MQYFVMAGVLIFLVVTLYLDFFKYFIGEEYREGLVVVPILLLANLCLGIYVNLSVWYKLSDKTGLRWRMTVLLRRMLLQLWVISQVVQKVSR